MFEDEMDESHEVRDTDEYRRLTAQDKRDEQLALGKAAASGLVGWALAVTLPNGERG